MRLQILTAALLTFLGASSFAMAQQPVPGQPPTRSNHRDLAGQVLQTIDDQFGLARRASPASNSVQSYMRPAGQYEDAARQIARIHTGGVDHQVAALTANMAAELRNLASSYRSAASRLRVLEAQRSYRYYRDPPYVYYSWGGFMAGRMPLPIWTWNVSPGTVHRVDNFVEVSARERQVVTDLQSVVARGWSSIEEGQQVLRQTTTAR
jgi:hypothetical protein